LEYPEAELSLALVNEDIIKDLNSRYRGYSRSTNVLSFPMSEGDFPNLHPEVLGDVVICIPVAQKEAEESGNTLENRLTELLVHGILHLVGYDHEKGGIRASEMEIKTKEILSKLKEPEESEELLIR